MRTTDGPESVAVRPEGATSGAGLGEGDAAGEGDGEPPPGEGEEPAGDGDCPATTVPPPGDALAAAVTLATGVEGSALLSPPVSPQMSPPHWVATAAAPTPRARSTARTASGIFQACNGGRRW